MSKSLLWKLRIGCLVVFLFGVISLVSSIRTMSRVDRIQSEGEQKTGQIIDKKQIRSPKGASTYQLVVAYPFAQDDAVAIAISVPSHVFAEHQIGDPGRSAASRERSQMGDDG